MNDDKPYIEEWHLKSELNIRKVWDVLLAKWHWFALSVFICLMLAFVYIRTVPVVYKREAVVQLKKIQRNRRKPSMKNSCSRMAIISTGRF